MDCPADLSPSDKRPGAGWLNRLLAFARSLVVRVSPGGELEARRTPSGTEIHFARYNCIKVAVTSGTISARSGSTPGSGTVVLRRLTPGSYIASATVTAYWADTTTIGSGVYVYVGLIDGYWSIISRSCAP